MAKTLKSASIQENQLALKLYIYQLTSKGLIVCIDYVVCSVEHHQTKIKVRRIDDHEVRFDYSVPCHINVVASPHKVFRALVSSIDLESGQIPDLDKYVIGEDKTPSRGETDVPIVPSTEITPSPRLFNN